MTIWRLHLRPWDLDPRGVVEHCIENRILGVGYRGEGLVELKNESTEDYLKRHILDHDGKKHTSVHLMMREVREGDFIWTRDEKGAFLLAQVTGSPHRRYGDWAELQDMFHVAPVRFAVEGSGRLDDVEVPGKVKAAFGSRGQSLCRIWEPFVSDYTSWLFASKTGGVQVARPKGRLVNTLSAFELEDLVLLFLQEHGWRVVLSSHSPNTPRYECNLVRADGRTAGVQVKNGDTILPAAQYSSDKQVDTVLLFAASGNYGEGPLPPNVQIISEADLLAFTQAKPNLLPGPIAVWSTLEAPK